jgi:large subunit ribosomal protein L20
MAKGAYATKKNRWRMVKQHLKKVHTYAYVGRKDRKGDYRTIWIMRINAAARELSNMTYSQLMSGLRKANIEVDRKGLADLAMNDPQSFTDLATIAKQSNAAA